MRGGAWRLTTTTALAACERLSAVTALIGSVEQLHNSRDRTRGGLNDWAVTRRDVRALPEPSRRLYDVLGRESVTRELHAARVLAALVLLAPVRARVPRLLAGGFLAGSARLLHPRHRYGSDGSDQLAFLVQCCCALARAGQGDDRVVAACLRFLAAQATTAYLVSGCAKLAGTTWRRGTALAGVLRTRTYGNRRAHRWCLRHPLLAKLAGFAVIGIECGFPTVFARRGRLAPAVLSLAGVFHLATAAVMGLGRFFWAFLSSYPAVLHVARHGLSRPARPRGGWVCGAVEVGLAAWWVLTLLRQCQPRAADWTRRCDWTGLLLPDWRFFAPEPARHDFRVSHRLVDDGGRVSPWDHGAEIAHRRWRQALWFPERRADKALFDACSGLLRQVERAPAAVQETTEYHLLRGLVERRITEAGDHSTSWRAFQFAVTRHAGYDTSYSEQLYVSPVVPLARDLAA